MNNINKIPPFRGWVLENFPFIEADFDAITNYQLISKVIEYLNKVIESENQQNTAIEDLYNKFIELKNYVDNLDLQEYVDTKLDEMAESGQLDQIIEQYLSSSAVWGFDTVAEMKEATNLINGSYARTLGYHTKNDGGESLYKIRNITNDDVVDEATIIEIGDSSNELIAELIFDKELRPEQFGAYGDNTHDDSTAILNCFNKARDKGKAIKLTKNYYLNTNIELNGLVNDEKTRVDILQPSGALKIDSQVIIKQIAYSNITIKLQNGGSGNIDSYAVIFRNLRQCSLDLQANDVDKTAFYMNSEKTPTNTEIKFCNVKLRGYNNLRTLLHGSSNSSLGDGFGNYIDIVDGSATNPIKFINCRDVNILHYENLINDETYLKNSLELINSNIRSSLMCVGGRCKNLIYLEESTLNTDYMLLYSEETDTEGSTTDELQVTGVYIKGASKLSVNYISGTKCKNTINATEMTNQANLSIGYTFINPNTTPVGGGALIPDISNTLLSKYNRYDRSISITPTSETFDLSHIYADKIEDQVHINGYIQISADIPTGTEIMEIGNNNKSNHQSYGFIRQGDKIIMCSVPNNTSQLKNSSKVEVANGTTLYIDIIYRARKLQ